MSDTHTPGPWRYQREISNRVIRYEVYTAQGVYGHAATCAKEADAMLVTMAPELLQCLKDCMPNEREDDWHMAWWSRARAVIAKAEGKQ